MADSRNHVIEEYGIMGSVSSPQARFYGRVWEPEDLAEFFRLENQPGRQAKIATQHLKLYHLVRAMDHPTVVECGVDVGCRTASCLPRARKQVAICIRSTSAIAPAWPRLRHGHSFSQMIETSRESWSERGAQRRNRPDSYRHRAQ